MKRLIVTLTKCLLCVGMAFALAAAGPTGTALAQSNSAWLPLPDLIKRWNGTPLEHIETLAKQGDAQAEHYLGYCNSEGFRTQQDPETGAKWYQQALQNGYVPAANNLGILYQRGLLGSPDLSKALYYYKYAADRGLPLAWYNLGCLYRDGQGVPQDLAESFRLFQLASDHGNLAAMTELYCCYWNGSGVVPDHARAIQWLSRAAEAENPRAQCLLAYRCENPEWEVNGSSSYLPPPKSIEAFQWYRRAAQQNWAEGQYHLGLYYLDGKVVQLDEEKALQLVRLAADQGLKEALIELAALYAQGIGEPRSEQDRPLQLLKQARDWSGLIIRYEYGLGTEKDPMAVARCYCQAAMEPSWNLTPDWLLNKIEFKSPNRQWGMPVKFAGDGHVEILGPPSDIGNEPSDDGLQFISWYLKSALGDPRSAIEIANAYLAGQKVPKSIPHAWLWFMIATQNGSNESLGKAAALKSQMGVDDLTKAQNELDKLVKESTQIAVALHDRGGNL